MKSRNNFFLSDRAFKSKPSEATLRVISSGVSSKASSTPGSPYSSTPLTRNSIPSIVLPQPGPPHTIVVRPRGKPPPLISSRPRMPVGAFSSPCERSRTLSVPVSVSNASHVYLWRLNLSLAKHPDRSTRPNRRKKSNDAPKPNKIPTNSYHNPITHSSLRAAPPSNDSLSVKFKDREPQAYSSRVLRRYTGNAVFSPRTRVSDPTPVPALPGAFVARGAPLPGA